MFSKKTPYYSVITTGAILILLYFAEFSFSSFTSPDQTSRELPTELRQTTPNSSQVSQTDPTETLKNLNNALANIAAKANPAKRPAFNQDFRKIKTIVKKKKSIASRSILKLLAKSISFF
mgnify:CR=1 FL=1